MAKELEEIVKDENMSHPPPGLKHEVHEDSEDEPISQRPAKKARAS